MTVRYLDPSHCKKFAPWCIHRCTGAGKLAEVAVMAPVGNDVGM